MSGQSRAHLGLRAAGHLVHGDGAAAIEVSGLAQQAVAPGGGGESALYAAVEADFVGPAGRHVHDVLRQGLLLLQHLRQGTGAKVGGLRALCWRAHTRELGCDHGVTGLERAGAKGRSGHAARKAGVVKHQQLVGALCQRRQACAEFDVGQHAAVGGHQTLGAIVCLDCFVEPARAMTRVVDEDAVAVGHARLQGRDLVTDAISRGFVVAQRADVGLGYGHGGGHAPGADHVMLDALERRHRRIDVLAHADDQRVARVARGGQRLSRGAQGQRDAQGQGGEGLHSSVTTRTRRFSAASG